MEYTRLGSSGLKVSRIAMGTMSFGDGSGGREGWPIPYDDAAPFFRQALDLGITVWDTANCYSSGTSEASNPWRRYLNPQVQEAFGAKYGA